MTESNHDFILANQPYLNIPTTRVIAWQQFFKEATETLRNSDLELIRAWGKQSLIIAADTTVRRAMTIWQLLKSVARGAWKEFKMFFRALWNGNITEYFKDVCQRAWKSLRAAWSAIKDTVIGLKTLITDVQDGNGEKLTELAVSFLGAVIGFVLIGGKGDGGLIDTDIMLLGIGGHRSIWFHSIFIGLAAEVCIRSAFELIALLYKRIPEQHSPIWERMLKVSQRFRDALVAGSWVGVATHLAIDSRVGGWTPYKDLPVVLPNWGHHLIMDLDATAAGWIGWQWHDKVRRHLQGKRFEDPTINGEQTAMLQPLLS